MNLIVKTIDNAQMQTICEAKFIGAQIIIEKKIKGEVKLKGEKRISWVVTTEIQLTSSMKSQTLNKKKSFQDSDHGRASKSWLVLKREDNQISVRSSHIVQNYV